MPQKKETTDRAPPSRAPQPGWHRSAHKGCDQERHPVQPYVHERGLCVIQRRPRPLWPRAGPFGRSGRNSMALGCRPAVAGRGGRSCRDCVGAGLIVRRSLESGAALLTKVGFVRIIFCGHASLDISGADFEPSLLATFAAGSVCAGLRFRAARQSFCIPAGQPRRHFDLIEAVARRRQAGVASDFSEFHSPLACLPSNLLSSQALRTFL